MKRRIGAVACAFMLVGLAVPAQAQEPIDVPGEVVVVPLAAESPIELDGDLGDWATLPAIVTNDGPMPSLDPANSGQMRWQVAADATTFYFAATITDDNIVAGRNGDDYWNEDSIELYLDLSGDDTLRSYGDGVGQITFSAVDRGNTDPEQLSLSGSGAPDFDVRGFVFATTAGWGVEMAIDMTDKVVPTSGESIGFQVQANGSSGGDRDLKLSWSLADTDDTSYQDPSVFGRAVFFDPGAAAIVDETEPVIDDEAEVASEESLDVAIAEQGSVDPVPAEVVTESNDDEPKPGRTLLYAAIFSAASILVGGLWFERRRKKSEAAAAATAAEVDDQEDVDDLIASILDDQ